MGGGGQYVLFAYESEIYFHRRTRARNKIVILFYATTTTITAVPRICSGTGQRRRRRRRQHRVVKRETLLLLSERVKKGQRARVVTKRFATDRLVEFFYLSFRHRPPTPSTYCSRPSGPRRKRCSAAVAV